MKILFDPCVDHRLRQHFPEHEVQTAYEMGWASYQNGALLAAAEETGFTVFLTTDRNLPYQQNLSARALAVVVLSAPTNRLQDLLPLVPEVERILPEVQLGQAAFVQLP